MLRSLFRWPAALGLLLLGGCHHADPVPAVAVASFTGQVAVFDQQPNTQALPAANVTVTALGTAPLVSTTTDTAGRFSLPYLPAGTYALSFTRPGLSSFYLHGLAHPVADHPDQLTGRYYLYAEPDVEATDLQAQTRGGQVELTLTLRSPQPPDLFRYALYLSTSPTVNFTDTPVAQQGGFGSSPATATTGSVTLAFDRAKLQQAGLAVPSGTTVYAVAYGVGLWSMYYFDPVSGQQLDWPSTNHRASPVVSFPMP